MKVLIGCEESQTVCKAFRERGHEAYSCDIQPCSGGHPEWHFNKSIFDVLSWPEERVQTGKWVKRGWDLLIAHPPCTYMSRAGARWMYPTAGNVDKERFRLAMEAKEFFMALWDQRRFISKVCIENPTPLKIVGLPAHSQVIQPYEYGHAYSKRTLLWLSGLPDLKPAEVISEHSPYLPSNTGGKKRGQSFSRGVAKNAKEASKTFPGIAKAMAEQWGDIL